MNICKTKYYTNIKNIITDSPLVNKFFQFRKNIYTVNHYNTPWGKHGYFNISKIDLLKIGDKEYQYNNYPICTVDYCDKKYIYEVDQLFVLDEYRGMGLGSFLMNKVEKEAIKNNATHTTLFIHKNMEALDFYTKLGYKFYRQHDDRIVYNVQMIKKNNID